MEKAVWGTSIRTVDSRVSPLIRYELSVVPLFSPYSTSYFTLSVQLHLTAKIPGEISNQDPLPISVNSSCRHRLLKMSSERHHTLGEVDVAWQTCGSPSIFLTRANLVFSTGILLWCTLVIVSLSIVFCTGRMFNRPILAIEAILLK